jgi:hypothetical protein
VYKLAAVQLAEHTTAIWCYATLILFCHFDQAQVVVVVVARVVSLECRHRYRRNRV